MKKKKFKKSLDEALRLHLDACEPCCQELGALTGNYCNTVWKGVCCFCGQITTVNPVSDRRWPNRKPTVWD